MDADAVNLALLALRVAAGVVMFAHGWNHLARTREGRVSPTGSRASGCTLVRPTRGSSP
jgi:uncharacterized membrane protein YphA (DoxX/SURF4 family)